MTQFGGAQRHLASSGSLLRPQDDRALVHTVAHRLPGLSKTSRADPDADGQRMVCVERVAPVALPADPEPPAPDPAPAARRSRWRRAAQSTEEACHTIQTAPQQGHGASSQCSNVAPSSAAGYPRVKDWHLACLRGIQGAGKHRNIRRSRCLLRRSKLFRAVEKPLS